MNKLSEFKFKTIPGLYHFNHYQHPNGTWIQIRHQARFFAIYRMKNGELVEFEDRDQLIAAVMKDHE